MSDYFGIILFFVLFGAIGRHIPEFLNNNPPATAQQSLDKENPLEQKK
ncbi:hypothetical protein HOL34_02740 [bacterium]|mgnify:CR=1|nr:hypothetical protein [bacterium]MBT3903492.1 hypothetical protein [bacterium]MBT4577768.1 hypothetical protein [bacterium]MBT5346242.1 hypothetical protein [bacterium]MBT6131038.1 hypothetical protein [bacterium]